ncbi:MAG: DUF2490 domain-containing protein [Prevotella sp.]|nr:DUF2490 domain-containing protein [Prevotella sp.]
MGKRCKIWALAVLLPCVAFSQSDFRSETSVELQKSLDERWQCGIELEMRTRDDLSSIDRLSAEVYADYKVLPWLKLAGGYVFLGDHNKRISHYEAGDREVTRGMASPGDRKNLREYWGIRHRLHASATAKWRFGRWRMSLRERWQYTYRPEQIVDGRYNYVYRKSDNVPHLYHGQAKNTLRSRLSAEYDIRHCPLTPFVSVETWHAWSLEQTRYTTGVEWKINKHHVVDVSYHYQHEADVEDDNPHRHVVGVSWQVKI